MQNGVVLLTERCDYNVDRGEGNCNQREPISFVFEERLISKYNTCEMEILET